LPQTRKAGPSKGAKTDFLFIVKESDQNSSAIPDEDEGDDVSTDEKVELIMEEVKTMKITMATMEQIEGVKQFISNEIKNLTKAGG